jgi:hypothetical protein
MPHPVARHRALPAQVLRAAAQRRVAGQVPAQARVRVLAQERVLALVQVLWPVAAPRRATWVSVKNLPHRLTRFRPIRPRHPSAMKPTLGRTQRP